MPLEIPVFSIHRGSMRTVAALGMNGETPGLDHLNALKLSNIKGFNITHGQIKFLTEVPILRPRQKFKLLDASRNIYEFKCSSGLRLYCFLDGNDLVLLTNGRKKNTKKEQNRDLQKAAEIYDKYADLRKSGAKLVWIQDENETAE